MNNLTMIRLIEIIYRNMDTYQLAKLISYANPFTPFWICLALSVYYWNQLELFADKIFEYEDYWGE